MEKHCQYLRLDGRSTQRSCRLYQVLCAFENPQAKSLMKQHILTMTISGGGRGGGGGGKSEGGGKKKKGRGKGRGGAWSAQVKS